MHLEKQRKVVQVLGPLLPMQETQVKLLASLAVAVIWRVIQ